MVAVAAAPFLLLAACQGSPGATAWIPEQAIAVIGVDWAGLVATPAYRELAPALARRPEFAAIAGPAGECGLDPATAVTTIVIGAGEQGDVAVTLAGPGLGDVSKFACLAGKAKDRRGEAVFTLVHDGSRPALRLTGGGVGWIVDAGTVVLASAGWAAAVGALVDGRGTAAGDGPHRELFARADRSKHVWFAAHVPAGRVDRENAHGAEYKEVVGWLAASDAFAVEAVVTLANAEQAASRADGFRWALTEMKTGDLDISAQTLDSLRIEANGATVAAGATVAVADVRKRIDAVDP